jgi:type IV secretory pathway VirJ component
VITLRLRHAFALVAVVSFLGSGRYAFAQASEPADPPGIVGLPVVEVPAPGAAGSVLAVILSGDGGWAPGDKQMAAALTQRGIPVVGLDVPSYLAIRRTPDVAAADLRRLLEHYLAAWHKQQVVLIGYSHGADLAPFMVSRLDGDLRNRIVLLALLGLENHASFEFHMADVVASISRPGDLPVLPEVQKLRGMRLLCVEGANEHNSLCASLDPSLAQVDTHTGGHRIAGKDGEDVVGLILSALPEPGPQNPNPARR